MVLFPKSDGSRPVQVRVLEVKISAQRPLDFFVGPPIPSH